MTWPVLRHAYRPMKLPVLRCAYRLMQHPVLKQGRLSRYVLSGTEILHVYRAMHSLRHVRYRRRVCYQVAAFSAMDSCVKFADLTKYALVRPKSEACTVKLLKDRKQGSVPGAPCAKTWVCWV